MKKFKQLFLLFITSLLIGCSSQQIPARQSTSILPTQPMSFLDFDHPRLHEIAGNKPLVIDEIVRTHNLDPKYVAVIVETGDSINKQELLLFRVSGNTSSLIYDLGPYYYISIIRTNTDHPSWLLSNNYSTVWEIHDFFRYAKNLELPVMMANGGNCYDCANLKVISIPNNGNAEDITPKTHFVPKGFVDIDGNGKFEIVATCYYEFDYGARVHTASPYAFHLFAWNGTTYVDVSKDEKKFYDDRISELVNRLRETYNQPLNSGIATPLLSEIFFDYESSGRVNYGWEQIKSLGDLIHWDIKNTSPKEIKNYREVFNQLEQRKNKDDSASVP